MKKITMNLAMLAIATLATTSCVKDVEAGNPVEDQPPLELPANNFDFKTTQDVAVNIDYSNAGANGAVFFEIYTENPIIKTEENGIPVVTRNENIKPVYGGYTQGNGKFNKTITLPAYAKHLYIVSSNMLLNTRVLEADVNAGQAVAKAEGSVPASSRAAAANRAAQTTTVPVNLYSWAHDGNGNSKEYGDITYSKITTGKGGWYTPLGSWDSYTGKPNYLLDRNDAANKDLVFSDEELKGLFELIGNAVAVDRNCPQEFREPGDLTLQRNSEVAINMLGGTTMWGSTLGYYYYNGTKPTSLASTPIIMLFPNTNDGQGTAKDWGYNIIGVDRGDAVKLVYYPNIANGDLSGATTEFPAGTSIGFVLKSNGWAAELARQGAAGKYHSAVLNWWATSTDGLSYCPDNVESGKSKLGEKASRTAKFSYTSGGDEFAVISFEDMNHDTNFADVAFALKPASAFQPLPEVVNKVVDESGIYAFEDLWPSKGDYDMNDVVIDYKYTREFKKYKDQADSEYKTFREAFSFTTYQNYAELHSGLAFTFSLAANPSSILFKKRAKGSENFEDANFTVENDDNVVILTEDINTEIGTEYLVEVTYENGITNRSTVKPFIFRASTDGKRREIHLPMEAPTSKMDISFFHTQDDKSDVENGIYYVRSGDYPFAFYLAGGQIDWFTDTILKPDFEREPINKIYPHFIDWSRSSGAQYPDWYIR